jgi:hypothetical protein
MSKRKYFFDDWKSLLYIEIGAVVSLMPIQWRYPIIAAFIFYEGYEVDSLNELVYNLMEFAIGILLGLSVISNV